MKKIFYLLTALLLVSCNNNDTDNLVLPSKNEPNSFYSYDSPINTTNIDSYLFREDCQYFDFRNSEWFSSDGYIAGFKNIPFWEFLSSYHDENSLFKCGFEDINTGEYKGLCYPNTFKENYEESKELIEEIFSKTKKLIFISQSGVESYYVCNLLVQLGYQPENMYNIGGFKTAEGIYDIPYSSYADAKYLISGNPLSFKLNFDFTTLTKKGE